MGTFRGTNPRYVGLPERSLGEASYRTIHISQTGVEAPINYRDDTSYESTHASIERLLADGAWVEVSDPRGPSLPNVNIGLVRVGEGEA